MTMAEDYQNALSALLDEPVYGLSQSEKLTRLQAVFALLHEHHNQHCTAYHNMFRQPVTCNTPLDQLPFIAVRLFKLFALKSVPDNDVVKCLMSSGTSGQVPSRIFLDSLTSRMQSKALVKILQQFLGKQRLPMLIIDSPDVKGADGKLNARAAGIQGLAMFGRDHTYALNPDMTLNTEAISAFSQRYHDQPVLVFGFTFMVWQHFVSALKASGMTLHLPHAHLFHSGGWKKLEAQKVSNETFKQQLLAVAGISAVTNFYGMAEQVGSVFMECEEGMLHAPVTAEVIVRNPYDLSLAKTGESGLIQVLSALPYSYPGYSILTEDRGTIHGVGDCKCGRSGTYFTVQGRLPKVEVRGCSDTSSSPGLGA
ncbi:Acyl-protein synthetase, LuxE [Marisediminitalea aggregata]|uniref:Acyl-protein synthetase, LuxE n=1 Tax=Marisediminitalea aggregata TaxID=634436 RepID=A0A1M5GPR2_9ALTE|nr:acyl-protein synthetase [Marisediminitalea aggregata]SHG05686.1 Acyl-protein synthetase, LuxE [Marisediminitalea aggregata]